MGRSIVLLLMMLIVGTVRQAENATRLGLHVTQEELNCWKQRAGVVDPNSLVPNCTVKYKTNGDVSPNSPGDWTRIKNNRDTFASGPSSGRWLGPTTTQANGCIARSGANNPPGAGEDYSIRLRDTAFHNLVSGTTMDHAAVKNELLTLAGATNWQFNNLSLWCDDDTFVDHAPGFLIASWLTRVFYAYQYMGRAAFSASELTTLDNWFWHAADFWRHKIDFYQDDKFGDGTNGAGGRWNGVYTTRYACLPPSSGITEGYEGAPHAIQQYGVFNNNRRGALLRFTAMVGIALDDIGYIPPSSRHGATPATMITSGKLFVKEVVMFWTYPDGSFGEFERRGEGSPDQGINYAASTIAQAMIIADALARRGDLELYNFTSSGGGCNSQGTISSAAGFRAGQNKDLRFLLQAQMKYINDTYDRRCDHDPNGGAGPCTATALTSQDYRFDGRHPRSGTLYWVNDMSAIFANLFYQDAEVKSTYMRTHAGTVGYASNPQSMIANANAPWNGENATLPAMLFMFGDMEGVVNPHVMGGGSLPAAPTNLRIVSP